MSNEPVKKLSKEEIERGMSVFKLLLKWQLEYEKEQEEKLKCTEICTEKEVEL